MGHLHIVAPSAALLLAVTAGCSHAQPTPTANNVPPAPPVNTQPVMAPNGMPMGYYRQPAIHKDLIVFVAEGDLWTVSASGGVAHRLTSHPGDEGNPVISRDGLTIAFSAQYEGPTEIYTMPVTGGLPTRRTFDAARSWPASFTADGKLVYSTNRYSTIPNQQMFVIDLANNVRTPVPLSQAADGGYDPSGKTLYFTRLWFQGSQTKRYKGGTAQQLWKYTDGQPEAVALTVDYAGTSKLPTVWNNRVYFLTDRDGTMNVWSMTTDGKDLKQHSVSKSIDAAGLSVSDGKAVYQLGADIHLLDLTNNKDTTLVISLDSDFDQTREHWVKDASDYLTSTHISADGERVVLTARGRIYSAPAKQGRFVEVSHTEGSRIREARFSRDGKSIYALSDKSGEVELWKYPANGVGEPEQLSTDGNVLRWDHAESPDGKFIAHHDKNLKLWLYDAAAKQNKLIDQSKIDNFDDLEWSSDSRYLVYTTYAENAYHIVRLYSVETGKTTTLTSDRYDSYSATWSADGKWLYFLSDRNLHTIVPSPWGQYQPEPFITDVTKIYALALKPGERSPWQAKDELHADSKKDEKKDDERKEKKKKEEPKKDDDSKKESDKADHEDKSDDTKKDDGKKDERKDEAKKDEAKKLDIQLDGVQSRLIEVPAPAGNYRHLVATEKALFYTAHNVAEAVTEEDRQGRLLAYTITNDNPEVKTVATGIAGYELSGNGKKLLVHKGKAWNIIDASASPADFSKAAVNLGGWTLSVVPRQEWRQMFIEAWRLERDYFYDVNMHGVDWKGMLDRYLPMVDRVSTRGELADLTAKMVSEVSALHTFVYGGDLRGSPDNVNPASFGATLIRDPQAGGYRVDHIYQNNPDEPSRASPLAKPGVDIKSGDVIESIDGEPTLSVTDYAQLLRGKSDRQVLVHVKSKKADGTFETGRDVIVYPCSQGHENDLRYHEWEYTRAKTVDTASKGEIGYVHLRAMGGGDYADFAKGYFPSFNKQGMIIDVRHNNGGNIDSWILSRLLRKPWMFWNQHAGQAPAWNMQQAFRGYVVVLCDERTASDGEAFSEGFKRLGLGKVIGTRTWGGEIWLSSSNHLVDHGIATAAEMGVFGIDGTWLVEGHGVEPDIVVDNLPHASYLGEDAQLKAAIDYLQKQISDKPIPPVVIPKLPVKATDDNRKR